MCCLTGDMEQVLMQVVEEFAAFLELNGADELDPEVAEWGRMRLRTRLAELTSADKERLAQFLDQQRDLSTGAYRDWMEGLPGRLGL